MEAYLYPEGTAEPQDFRSRLSNSICSFRALVSAALKSLFELSASTQLVQRFYPLQHIAGVGRRMHIDPAHLKSM